MVTVKVAGVDVPVADVTPPGVISAFGGTTAPTGWLLCDGTAYSRTTYALLFAAIGTAYGSGDGSTTFNVPDLRGRFLRGVDGTAGIDPDKASRTALSSGGNTGNAVGSAQADALQGHIHPFSPAGQTNTSQTGSTYYHFSGGSGSLTNIGDPAADSHSNGTPRTTKETRPTNVYVNYLIKT